MSTEEITILRQHIELLSTENKLLTELVNVLTARINDISNNCKEVIDTTIQSYMEEYKNNNTLIKKLLHESVVFVEKSQAKMNKKYGDELAQLIERIRALETAPPVRKSCI
jgi:hypothetical protein